MSADTSRRSNALQVVLTVIAVAAGGLLLLLVVLAAAGSFLFVVPQGIDPAMAGLAPGRPAPPLEADAWVNGEPRDLAGKVVVVQGWFYHCPYCWREAPRLAGLHKKYGDRVAFVALCSQPEDTAAQVAEFVSKNQLKYPVGYGLGSAATLAQGFKASHFPAVWIVGKDGRVVWNIARDAEQPLEEAIEAALGAETT